MNDDALAAADASADADRGDPRAAHDKAMAGGLIAATGVIGPVIPPSIGFVIFGVAANVSISKLFLAGIVPGLLIGAALWLTWAWLVRLEKIVPPPKKSHGEVTVALREQLAREPVEPPKATVEDIMALVRSIQPHLIPLEPGEDPTAFLYDDETGLPG